MRRTLSMLIVSDLHAYTTPPDKGDPPSSLQVASPETPPSSHPFASLKQLIANEDLEVDLVLCCGDMSDRADPQALRYAWEQLRTLAEACSAQLVATAGNHDLDSRFAQSRFDPKSELQKLEPQFPVDVDGADDRYWARNYAIVHGDGYRVVTLNSCAYHGYAGQEQTQHEHEHGRVSKDTVERMMRDLDAPGADGRTHSVLICHHHPISIDPADPDEMMVDGHLLIEALQREGPWLVVHGHKHIPHLRYAAGGADSPVVFSAGSMCATLWREATTRTRNQVYVVRLVGSDELRRLPGSSMAGSFEAWEWIDQVGWQRARPGSGLPREGGFGYRGSPRVVATDVKEWIHKRGEVVRWDEIEEEFPQVRFLLPSDFDAMLKDLDGDLVLTPEQPDAKPVEIGPRG